MNQPEVLVTVTAGASAEVRKFMDQEGVDPAKGGLRVSVQPGGCSGFKYGLLIEDLCDEHRWFQVLTIIFVTAIRNGEILLSSGQGHIK